MYSVQEHIRKYLSQDKFWFFKTGDGIEYLYHRTKQNRGFLWGPPEELQDMDYEKFLSLSEYLKNKSPKIGNHNWLLPTLGELKDFYFASENPWTEKVMPSPYFMLRSGVASISGFIKGIPFKGKITLLSYIEIDESDPGFFEWLSSEVVEIKAAARPALTLKPSEILHKPENNTGSPSKPENDIESFLKQFNLQNAELERIRSRPVHPEDENKDLSYGLFSRLDWYSTRQPILSPSIWEDPNLGLWELWGIEEEILRKFGWRARNPALDVIDSEVAIDFGTSSTVVAYLDGRPKLIRIGAGDYSKEPTPYDFENPTILEFVNFRNMLSSWQAHPYRPLVSWDDVRCSHEALEHLRNNETDVKIVSSMLPRLKQWALREAKGGETIITDQEEAYEYKLPPLTLRVPVKGEPIEVGPEYPFDPIELYAWFIGMMINWRQRGIYLRYIMTFPANYPREVKDKILASFKRGLQRSLPASLVGQPVFDRFEVEERASEPTAYAVCALKEFGIEPTPEGVAYAVFDFGGGTTDFDFGFYRTPTPEEEDLGYEEVIEHFKPSGDPLLGGENILENMAYIVYRRNLDMCRKYGIVFTKPFDADDFPGSEVFLDKSRAAQTNTLVLMSRLRPLWERGQYDNKEKVEKLILINRQGEKVTVELTVPVDELNKYLEERIGEGIKSFYSALSQAFSDRCPEKVHVLLAGNGSRSEIVKRFFNLSDKQKGDNNLMEKTLDYLKKLMGRKTPEIIVYPPLEPDPSDLYKPTAKTGVAIGLLRLARGGVVKEVNLSEVKEREGEAPFLYYIGRVVRGVFQPRIVANAPYNQWFELGPQREGRFKLYVTKNPLAASGDMKEDHRDLKSYILDFASADGHKVFARAVSPTSIEICTAPSREAVDRGEYINNQVIDLVGRLTR